MTDVPPTLPPAAWYTDPQTPERQRWWNGAAWTESVRPLPLPDQPVVPSPTPVDAQELSVQQSTKKARRGFLDSPFEKAGTPWNTPGNLSVVFALLPFVGAFFGGFLLAGHIVPVPTYALFALVATPASYLTAVVLGVIGLVRAGRIGARRVTAIVGLSIVTVLVVGGIAVAMVNVNANLNAAAHAADVKVNVQLVESQIAQGVQAEVGEPVTVSCPPDPKTDQGSTFVCQAMAADGKSWMIGVTFQDDQGSMLWDFVDQQSP